MKQIYYYVPPCPVCGSRRTGRYLRTPFMDHDYTYLDSLKNGELVRFSDQIPDDNCYCADCGHRWHKVINPVFISTDQKEEEKIARGTISLYESEMAARHSDSESGSKIGRFAKSMFGPIRF